MKEKIIALIEEILDVPKGTITENTQAADLEEWDSLRHVAIIGALEELGITIPLDEAIEISSVKEILQKCKKDF